MEQALLAADQTQRSELRRKLAQLTKLATQNPGEVDRVMQDIEHKSSLFLLASKWSIRFSYWLSRGQVAPQNADFWPLPPLRPKLAAYGVAGLRPESSRLTTNML